ncbi:MAG: hypothetical protein JWO56_3704 [Acidobacteria bacterium]|nr:hypothetical protein [Acidobacteriota bacterium]
MQKPRAILSLLALLLLTLACSSATSYDSARMNAISERYVKLVLAMGEHDADYVDAYYGPPEWRTEVKAQKKSLDDIAAGAVAVLEDLKPVRNAPGAMEELRLSYLRRQTAALLTRVDMLRGKKLTFDEESRALYDAVAPHHDEAYFQHVIASLEKELPGSGALADRLDAYKQSFVIPHEKLDTVFKAAIDACRARTLEHIQLPQNESFTVEYVTNKSWSGYNWYQGGYRSLIQVNTDLPIYIDRAIDLACHEGYPGHHVYNALLEKNLVRDRGWTEFTVYPLFSPQSLIAEGSANYGIEVAFPGHDRIDFEKSKLFPLAGIDPSTADRYYRIQELIAQLSYAGNEAARQYLDGKITAGQAAEWLSKYALYSPPRARQRLKFIDQYRSYVINYNLGKDLVRDYVERHASGDRTKRWDVFKELLSSPRLPSELAR